jgi:hypothetical protein
MKRTIAFCLLFTTVFATAQNPENPSPIKRAHAHNDYEHKRPLFDALEQGFCSVEADIFLTKDGLLVGHTPFDLKPERTLQKLYLDPLRKRIKENNGQVYKEEPTFFLLIDVKTEAKSTYSALSKVLAEYADIFTVTQDGKTTPKAITAVVSGNCDREAIAAEKVRYATVDGKLKDLEGKEPATLIPWVSSSWTAVFKWNGVGTMPEKEQKQLREYAAKAHEQGRLIRFWAAPDKPESWAEQLADGVDLVNTDKLAEYRQFFLKQSAEKKP